MMKSWLWFSKGAFFILKRRQDVTPSAISIAHDNEIMLNIDSQCRAVDWSLLHSGAGTAAWRTFVVCHVTLSKIAQR
jgi:hypothetical protein